MVFILEIILENEYVEVFTQMVYVGDFTDNKFNGFGEYACRWNIYMENFIDNLKEGK